MSVTFEPAPTELSMLVLDWRIECRVGDDPRRFASEEHALAGLADHHQHCRADPPCWPEDLYVWGRTAGHGEPRLDVSSVNAGLLLRALGLRPELGPDTVLAAGRAVAPESRIGPGADDLTGDIDADELLERIAVALALHPDDAGLPAHAWPGPGALFIDCGRRPGYLQDRLAELAQVAQYAATAGRRVRWA